MDVFALVPLEIVEGEDADLLDLLDPNDTVLFANETSDVTSGTKLAATYIDTKGADQDEEEKGDEEGDRVVYIISRPKCGGQREVGITQELLRQYFSKPIKVAASRIGLSLSCMKKVCRKLGVYHWPSRKLKSLQSLRASIRGIKGSGRDKLLSTVDELYQKIMMDPDVQIDEAVDQLRNAQYKGVLLKRHTKAA